MRTRHEPETTEQRSEREEQHAQFRKEQVLAEAEALDKAVRKSIKLHGP